jgi:hypothetical protein
VTGSIRMLVAILGGWLALRLTGSLTWMFAALAAAMVVYGVSMLAAVASGVWFRGLPRGDLRRRGLPKRPM